MGIHDGHRARLRERYAQEGLDSFNDINTLELLLFYAIPRKDTNELAHSLLRKFGSLAGVFDASYDDLCAVEGMTGSAAILLRLMNELHRKYLISRNQAGVIHSLREAQEYLVPFFYGRRDEMVYLLLLDAAGKVLNCKLIGHGSVNSANVPMRRVVQEALTANASGVVLAHNHPSGVALPSKEDADLTARLRDTLDALQILLLDHIVVADDDFVSMRESGYFQRMY